MRKFVSFVTVFLFTVSQLGFCDDLINVYSPKKASKADSTKLASSSAPAAPVDTSKPKEISQIYVVKSKKADIVKPPKDVTVETPKPSENLRVEEIVPKKTLQAVEKPKDISRVEPVKSKKIDAHEPSKAYTRIAKHNLQPDSNLKEAFQVESVKSKRIDTNKPGKSYDRIPKQAMQTDLVKSIQKLTDSGLFGISRGNNWRIVPGFRFLTQYDSNVNREPPGHRNEDIIFNYIPSIELKRTGSRYSLRTGYEMTFQEFLRDSNQNSFNHIVTTKFSYTGNRLKVKLDETFSHIRTYASSEQNKRRTVMINDVAPEIIYQLTPKFSVSSIYQNYVFSYKESVLKENNYITNNIGGRLYYHVTPKLDLFVQGAGFDTSYYNSGRFDSKGYTILVGTEGRLSRKFLTNLNTGFKGNRYDDLTINSYYDWILEGAVQYLVTRKMNITVTAKRDKQESVYRDTAWYQSNFIGLACNYRITQKISMTAESSIRRNAYPREETEGTLTKKRRDYILEMGVALKWNPIKNLIFVLGYNLRERLSNFDNVFDYVAHVLDASVSYQFT